MKKRILHTIGLFIVLTLVSCSTKKNTAVTRFYHSFTTRYNVYFNGIENYKEQLKEMEEGYEDGYEEEYPAENYTDEEVSQDAVEFQEVEE